MVWAHKGLGVPGAVRDLGGMVPARLSPRTLLLPPPV